MDLNPVNMFETMVNVVKNNKTFDIIKTIVIIVLLVYITYNINEVPDIIRNVFNSRTTEMQIEHDKAVERRRDIKPMIDATMLEVMNTLGCDRVYVLEMHNGTNNTAGLPFIYGEMTYEITRSGIEHVDEDYTSINLSRFDFPLYLEENHFFCGGIEQLSEVDNKLSLRMTANGVTYMSIISMHGIDNELGYFGISYCGKSKPVTKDQIIKTVTVASQKLSVLLDSQPSDES